jgi:hypothetical protein
MLIMVTFRIDITISSCIGVKQHGNNKKQSTDNKQKIIYK